MSANRSKSHHRRLQRIIALGALCAAVIEVGKAAAIGTIAFHAWAHHHQKPWPKIFDHAPPAQLSCFGVPSPGSSFWSDVTLARAHARYPNWYLTPYREAMR